MAPDAPATTGYHIAFPARLQGICSLVAGSLGTLNNYGFKGPLFTFEVLMGAPPVWHGYCECGGSWGAPKRGRLAVPSQQGVGRQLPVRARHVALRSHAGAVLTLVAHPGASAQYILRRRTRVRLLVCQAASLSIQDSPCTLGATGQLCSTTFAHDAHTGWDGVYCSEGYIRERSASLSAATAWQLLLVVCLQCIPTSAPRRP